MEAFFGLKSSTTVATQLQAKLLQIRALLLNAEQWETGRALLVATVERVYGAHSEFAHLRAPADLYELTRLALQNGPLIGSKLGEFKRVSVANIDKVLVLLQCMRAHAATIGFSELQVERLDSWIRRANRRRTKLLQADSTSKAIDDTRLVQLRPNEITTF